MFGISDNSTFPVFGRISAQFWRWWREELSQSFAPLLRALSRGRKRGAAVTLSRSGANPAVENGSARSFQASMDPATWNDLHQSLARTGKHRAPIAVQLGPDLTLSRTASYPAGVLGKLDNIVALDVEKSTPFDADSALWKWRVIGRSNGQLSVETVILRRDHVLSVLGLARDAGLEIAEITTADEKTTKPLLLLKLSTAADKRRAFWRRVNTALAALLLLIGAGAAATAYSQQSAAYQALSAQTASSKARAIKLRRSQAEAEAQFESNAVLLREKAKSPSIVGLWNALSETLPASVWLTEMRITGRNGRISGFAGSAASLIEQLEGLTEISGVTFASPVTINPDDRSERFDISFTLEENHD